MEKKMETTIVYSEVIQGIMEKTMETAINTVTPLEPRPSDLGSTWTGQST